MYEAESAPRPPCVVLVDPSTGLRTFIDECRRHHVALVVVLTENARGFPQYFERPPRDSVTELIECDSARVDSVVAELLGTYDVREVCGGDEAGVPTAEVVNRRILGEAANDPGTVRDRVSKYRMHRALDERGLAVPRQTRFSLLDITPRSLAATADSWTFPVIIKPEECAGSVCTYRVDDVAQLGHALERARAERSSHDLSAVSDSFLLQEFIEGREFLVNAYSIDGRHFVTGVYHYEKFTNRDVPVYQSVNFDGIGDREAEVIAYVKRVLDTLGVRRGLTNTDLIWSASGPRLLEINARIVGFGGSLSRLERHLFGRNQASLVAMEAAGAPLSAVAPEGRFGKVVLLQSRFDRPMRTPRVEQIEALQSYLEHTFWKQPGQPLRNGHSYLNDTVGYVLLAHSEREQLERDFLGLTAAQNEGTLF